MVYMKVTYERIVRCVVVCENEHGQGSFVPVKVACNEEDFGLGLHYEAAEAWAVKKGYDVFVVVDEVEMQPATVLTVFDWDAAPLIDPKGEYCDTPHGLKPSGFQGANVRPGQIRGVGPTTQRFT